MCTATRINKATLTTNRPSRVHLPEPPKALKLRYAFLTLYSFRLCALALALAKLSACPTAAQTSKSPRKEQKVPFTRAPWPRLLCAPHRQTHLHLMRKSTRRERAREWLLRVEGNADQLLIRDTKPNAPEKSTDSSEEEVLPFGPLQRPDSRPRLLTIPRSKSLLVLV